MSRLAIWSLTVVALTATAVSAQTQKAPDAVAATVNGTPIPQAALDRALDRFSDEEKAKARPEILEFLIDNALVDQYLAQQKVEVTNEEISVRLTEIKKEIEKNGQTYEKVLASLKMVHEEFLVQVAADLKWEKFAQSQCTDANLKAMFDQNTEMFDGSMVKARHILLNPGADAKAIEAAKVELQQYRKAIEAKAAEAVAKLPATSDATTREQERQKQLELAFAAIATEKSTCPSKKDGGELTWFPRAGRMVEAFARTAFALKPYEMSDPVPTQFGVHLILSVGKKAGKAVKFEEVKEEVREVYCNRLREAISAHLRQTAKIVIASAK